MKAYETVNAWAVKELGSPYAWGGTGQQCTPYYRTTLMKQYPARSADMKRECQVHKSGGRITTCEGCKYKGKRLYDCAQLVRNALKMIGETAPSGATSLWKKDTLWSYKGKIEEGNFEKIKNTPCVVFRMSEDKKMAHVGINTGVGEIIEAMSTGFGVVRGDFKGPPRFTHYAIPAAYEIEGDREEAGIIPLSFGARGNETMKVQSQLVSLGYALPKFGADGKFGAETQAAVFAFRKDNGLGESLRVDVDMRKLLNELTGVI